MSRERTKSARLSRNEALTNFVFFLGFLSFRHSKVAMERLERLWIITQKNGKLSMSSTFREGLRRALTGG